jgi:Cu+-exporting ATPase
VLLDKTGTITTGAMAVVAVEPVPPLTVSDVLRAAAAVETASEHPIARAIVARALAAGIHLPPVADFRNEPGVGARGIVVLDDRPVEVSVRRAGPAAGTAAVPTGAAATVVEVVVGGRVAGRLALADTVKSSSRSGIAALRDLGLRPVLLTGDNEAIAAAVAAEVGIDPADVVAGVLPAGKVAVVRELQAQGRVVAMVGDGVNDAAALAQADLGIAMGTGTDVAIEASDLTLMRAEIPAVVDAVRLSRRTLATIKGNLFWAFAYNVAAIPLAATGLLSPVVASAAMAFSSVFVVSNSLRLRRFRSVSLPAELPR